MNVIRQLRKEKGISMKELGAFLGVTESAVSFYESGKRQPDYNTLMKIADYFDVSVDYLLGRNTQKNNAPLLSQKDVVINATPVQGSIDVETLLEYFALLTFSERQEFLKAALDVVVDSRSDGEQGKK